MQQVSKRWDKGVWVLMGICFMMGRAFVGTVNPFGVAGTKKIWLDGQYGFNRYVQCNFRQPFTAVHILHHGYYGGGAFL